VQSRTESQIVATIGVRKGALQGEFTTRNTLDPNRSIRMDLVSGPFRTLQGEWRLTPIENGCRVDLSMRFAFNNRLSAILFEGLFAETIGSLVDAFVTRARAQP
jgi:ribosome-associated toxin RatA of RatAB toxin-antitoxin module